MKRKVKSMSTNYLKLLIVCLMLATFDKICAQQRYYYQKVQEQSNGMNTSFPDSERKPKCLIFQGNTCQWEGDFVDTWNYGQHSRTPIVFNFIKNENGLRVYQYRNNSWSTTIMVSPDNSTVSENIFYPSTGNTLLKVYKQGTSNSTLVSSSTNSTPTTVMGGNSYSSSNSNKNNVSNNSSGRRCEHCNGNGRCHTCNGNYTNWIGYVGAKPRKCPNCTNGKCKYCGGTGRR